MTAEKKKILSFARHKKKRKRASQKQGPSEGLVRFVEGGKDALLGNGAAKESPRPTREERTHDVKSAFAEDGGQA